MKARSSKGKVRANSNEPETRMRRPGKSKGLAKLEREFRHALIAELQACEECESGEQRRNLQAIAHRWVQAAKSNDARLAMGAIKSLAERIWGRP